MKEYKVIYDDPYNNDYLLIEDNGELLIVHSDYLGHENAVLFKVAIDESDWSKEKLIDFAKAVVDYLNGWRGY